MSPQGSRPLRGMNVPRFAKVSVQHTGPAREDYKITMRNPAVTTATTEIPVFRPHDSRQQFPTSTVAVLQGGLSDELRISVSGWSGRFQEKYQLDNAEWTQKVFSLCKRIGHPLTDGGCRDHGVLGRGSACHAEKQLAAYVYYKCPGWQSAMIYSSKKSCTDCEKFLSVLRRKIGLDLRVVGGARGRRKARPSNRTK